MIDVEAIRKHSYVGGDGFVRACADREALLTELTRLQALVETLSGYEWQPAKKLVDAVMSITPPESKP